MSWCCRLIGWACRGVACTLLLASSMPLLALDPGRRLPQYSARMWQDELPQSSIHTIAQTADGYLWFGTYEGLVRFDGVRFVVFEAGEGGCLAGGTVLDLREDDSGRLWIATNAGLSVWQDGSCRSLSVHDGQPSFLVNATATDHDGRLWIATSVGLAELRDEVVSSRPTEPGGPGELAIRSLVVDDEGVLWMATERGLYSLRQGRFSRLGRADGLPDSSIRALAKGGAGVLWVGTNRGLVRRTADGRLEIMDRSTGMPSETVRALYEDHHQVLWIGTEDRGLVRRLPDGSFSALGADSGLSHDYVRSLAEDREGALWVGTNGGLNQLRDAKFTAYTTLEGLSHNYVRTVFADRRGHIWIGSDGGGLSRLANGEFRSYGVADGLANDSVRSIEEAADGSLWIGTRGGVSRLSAGSFTTFGVLQGLSDLLVRVVYHDREQRLWVGTENGLNLWRGDRFEVFRSVDGLVGNDVRALYQDAGGRLWIGTFSGISSFADGRFTNYTTIDGLSADIVFAFYEDPWGELWIGTDDGLNHFRDGVFTSFGIAQGLFDTKIFCFLEDDLGYLWMSSNRGVSRVSLGELHELAHSLRQQVTSESFGKSDGMQTNQCNGASQPAGTKGADGQLWFPTPRGVVAVDPAKLRRNQRPPPVLVEEVMVEHQTTEQSSPAVFPPGSKSFEIRYTALSFQAPEKVHFRYRLVGYDRRWVEAGTRRIAYYTSLAPGRYRFEVVACNDDGVWNEDGAQYSFVLERAPWQSYWAYALYLALGAGLIVAGVRWRLHSLARRTTLLESKVAERTAELDEKNTALAEKLRQLEISERNALLSERRALEANRAKSVFLSNMSHELRTPLNSIIGFSSIVSCKLDGAADDKILKFVRNIHGSGEHLLGLINDLLDLSKIEAGRMELTPESFDLAEVVEESRRVIQGVSHRKGISVVTALPAELPKLVADRAKLKQVLFNLLSNAVKFSASGSEVVIRACALAAEDSPLRAPSLRIDIIDHGIGIARHHLELIFEEFRQVDGSASREHEGTGLGLALVKRLLEMQGGRIRVQSELGKGSTFSAFIPLEVGGDDATAQELPALVESDSGGWPAVGVRSTILVVEDDPVAYHQLANSLEVEGYRVIGARDGAEAMQLVTAESPALITLDLVLPGLNGWEMLRELKAHHDTCRIPVVIVTRKDSRELCLALGADDFYLKPVNRRSFLAGVQSILTTRAERLEPARILVIDDDPSLHELLRVQLEDGGFTMISASGGREGLALVTAERPDLVVLDLLMPGMSGFEVAHRLRADPSCAELPVIVLTAKDVSPADREALADHIQALIAKDADSHIHLTAAIRELLARKAQRDA